MSFQRFSSFKRYTVTVLVLFYLQRTKLMPSIKEVQSGLRADSISGKFSRMLWVEISLFFFFLGWETQYDPDRDLGYYRITRLQNYQKYVEGFFKFYGNFDYGSVISTYYGAPVDLRWYKDEYRKFIPAAINVPGPLNREKICQHINFRDKDSFVKLCKASSSFFSNSDFGVEQVTFCGFNYVRYN